MGRVKVLRALAGCCVFVLLGGLICGSLAAAVPTPVDDLIEEGKALLLHKYDFDVYGADAKFAEALNLEPGNERANFWRAITIISSNPELKTVLIDSEVISPDPDNELLLFDQEGKSKYGGTPVKTIIIDNKDTSAGYSEVGADWQTVDPAPDGCYGDDCRIHAAGTGANKAVWTPVIQTTGEYEVRVWWPSLSGGNAPDAKFTVYYDGRSRTIVKDQRREAARWVTLGRFRFVAGGMARIELSDEASGGQVAADAVRLGFKGDHLDDTAAVFTDGSASWQDAAGGFGGSHKEIAAGTGGTCVWTPDIPVAGKYELDAYWAASSENATQATYEIRIGGALVDTVRVNQQKDNYRTVSLGIYEFQADTGNTITLLQNADGKVNTDGIRVILSHSDTNATEWQGILSSTLTEIDQALGYLGNVTASFEDTADVGATDENGNPYIIELDYGDALM